MKDIIVSVRMPRSMLAQLRILAKKNHYMDVSEEIRSVIRDRTAHYNQPYAQGVKRIATDLRLEMLSESRKGDAISKLKQLIEELEHGK